MANVIDIISALRSEGHRITPAREQIINTFNKSTSPISAIDLLEALEKLDNKVNKTTVYRELDFLLEKNLVREVEFGEGRKRYELNTGTHHHHLVCRKCKKVEDVDLKTDLSSEEKLIEKETGFKIESHSLEFFGYCKNCQK